MAPLQATAPRPGWSHLLPIDEQAESCQWVEACICMLARAWTATSFPLMSRQSLPIEHAESSAML